MMDLQKKRKIKKTALDWANYVRKINGQKPLRYLPKGKKSTVTMCPLANATGLNIMGKTRKSIYFGGVVTEFEKKYTGHLTKKQRKDIIDFISFFDRGAIPELVKKDKWIIK